MPDEQSRKTTRLGNREDIRTLVEWQQQRYHQLQNISLALLSGFLTVLAIIATIIAPNYPSIITPIPTSEQIELAASSTIFGFASVSAIVALNYLLSVFLFVLAGIFGFFGVYKLYNIVSNPPLRPKLEELNVVGVDNSELEALEEAGFNTIQKELQISFHKNQSAIEAVRNDFKMALIRLPAALFGGYFAAQLYFYTASLDIPNILLYDLVLLLPASVLTLILSKVFLDSEAQDSTPTSIGREIFKREGGRFPNQFIGPERWVTAFNNLLSFLVLLTIILELGYKFVV